MKTYLKNMILFSLYHPVSYLAGGLIAGFPGVILGAIFEANREPIENIVQPLLMTVIPLFFLFFFMQKQAYEDRRFSPLMVIGSSLPFFVVQIIYVLNKNYGMTIVGSTGIVTKVIFPNTENVTHYLLVQIGLQLLVYLPTYLLASYVGYRRVIKEIKEIKEEY